MMFCGMPVVVKVLLPMNTMLPAPLAMASIVPPPTLSNVKGLAIEIVAQARKRAGCKAPLMLISPRRCSRCQGAPTVSCKLKGFAGDVGGGGDGGGAGVAVRAGERERATADFGDPGREATSILLRPRSARRSLWICHCRRSRR